MTELTKADLAQKIFGIEQYTPGMPDIRDVALRITSGTTGLPSLVVNRRANTKAKRALVTAHARRLLALVPKRASFVKWTNDFLRPVDGQTSLEACICVDIGDIRSGAFSALIRDVRPDAIMSFPTSFIIEGVRALPRERKEQLARDIRHVILGGEIIASIEMRLLHAAFPEAEIWNTYGIAEADLFSAACPALLARYIGSPYTAVHPFDEDYGLSITEPDEDGFGEITLTTPELSRYRTGDIGALREESCVCGKKSVLLVAGRKDFDRVSLFGALFHAAVLIERMGAMSDFVADYLLEVRAGEAGGERRGDVTLLVVPKTPELPALVRERLLVILNDLPVSKTRSLSAFVADGLFNKPTIRTVEIIERAGSKMVHLRKVLT